MFRQGGNCGQAAAELLDTERWQYHGQMISWEDAPATSANGEISSAAGADNT